MSLYRTSSQRNARSLNQPDAASTRLQGGTLLLARGVWIAGAVAALVIFFASVPPYFTALHTVSASGLNLSGDQLTPEGLRQLLASGLSVDFYAAYLVIINVIFVVAWFVVGSLIFWRKSDDRIAFFASFALMIFSVSFTARTMVESLPASWWVPVQSVRFIAGMGLALFFYVFPDGRFMPRWTRWLLIGWLIHECFGDTFFMNAPFNPFVSFPLLDEILFPGLLVSLAAVQVYRYRRASNLLQRQQTKWVVFGMATAVLGFAALLFVGITLIPTVAQSGPLTTMIVNTVIDLLLLLIPISIGLAILRSRLWEIDIIINRSLVYGTLTVSLALIYVGSVLALQTLLRSFTEGNQFAIVGSTLVIAVLFQPLRRRIQAIIDLRFYRRKYDAARTLEGFSATLRSEVDLQQLREQLVAVVDETMQPTHVSLWLRPQEQIGKQSAAWINTPPASPREK
jgi:hypothetical protein